MIYDITEEPGFWEALMESVDGEGDRNWKRNLAVAAILLVFTILVVVAGITGALR